MPWSFRAAQALHKAGAIVCEGGVPPPEHRLAEMPQRIRHARRPSSTPRLPALLRRHVIEFQLIEQTSLYELLAIRELIVRLQPTQLRLASKRKDDDRLEQAL